MRGHLAGTFEGTGEQGRFFASCHCGWSSEQHTDSYEEAARWAVDHSDPDLLDLSVADMQMQYPHLSRDQILGLEGYDG
jgi:hypothetical protein